MGREKRGKKSRARKVRHEKSGVQSGAKKSGVRKVRHEKSGEKRKVGLEM